MFEEIDVFVYPGMFSIIESILTFVGLFISPTHNYDLGGRRLKKAISTILACFSQTAPVMFSFLFYGSLALIKRNKDKSKTGTTSYPFFKIEKFC